MVASLLILFWLSGIVLTHRENSSVQSDSPSSRAANPPKAKRRARALQHENLDALRSLRQHFAIFTTLPEYPSEDIAGAAAQTGLQLTKGIAQRLLGSSQEVWAIPGPKSVCMFIQESINGPVGSSCSENQHAIKVGLFIASLSSTSPSQGPSRLVVGLVPDGVQQVAVRTPGFEDSTVAVVDNTFTLRDRIAGPPEALEMLP